MEYPALRLGSSYEKSQKLGISGLGVAESEYEDGDGSYDIRAGDQPRLFET